VQPVLLDEAVRNALYLLEPEFSRRGAAPVLDTQGGPLAVLAEPVALEQIIHNLLMNALQAVEQVAGTRRRVVLGLRAEHGQGVLSVQDQGPGMAPQVLARIFEPFFTTRHGGLGLGLSLCETLAGAMGGTLTASSPASGGAQFSLSLPLAPPSEKLLS